MPNVSLPLNCPKIQQKWQTDWKKEKFDLDIQDLRERVPLKVGVITEEVLHGEKLRKCVLYIMGICAVFNLSFTVAGIVCAALVDSSAGYAFAMDCLLDLLCSLVVFWRYYGLRGTIYSNFRENTSCLVLGILFLLSSAGIVIKATIDLAQFTYPNKVRVIFILTAVASVICTVLAGSKFYLYRKLQSQSLLLDAINTALTSVLGLLIVAAETVYHYYDKIWFMDPLSSIIVGLFLFIYGIRSKVTRILDHWVQSLTGVSLLTV